MSRFRTNLALLALLLPLYTRSTSPVHIFLHSLIVALITPILVFFAGKPFRKDVAGTVAIAIAVSWFGNHIADYAVVGEWNRLNLAYAISWNPALRIIVELGVEKPKVRETRASLMAQFRTRISHSTVLVTVHPAVEAALFTYLLKDSINTEGSILHGILATLAVWVTITSVIQEISFWLVDVLDDDGQAKVIAWCYRLLQKAREMVMNIPDLVNYLKESFTKHDYAAILENLTSKSTEEDDDDKAAHEKLPAYWPVARNHEWQVLSGENDLGAKESSSRAETLDGADDKVVGPVEIIAPKKDQDLEEDEGIVTGKQLRPSTRRRG